MTGTRRSIAMTAAHHPARAEVAARVWSALQAFVAAHDRRARTPRALDLGRGLGRVKVLVLLHGGPLTLREIAEANAVDAPYATVIVDKLVSRGLVERTAHPDDNRRKLVSSPQQAARPPRWPSGSSSNRPRSSWRSHPAS